MYVNTRMPDEWKKLFELQRMVRLESLEMLWNEPAIADQDRNTTMGV